MGAQGTLTSLRTFPAKIGSPVFLSRLEGHMLKSKLLSALQSEIRRHDFNYFVDHPPSIAQGGKGVVVPGCPACRTRINTMGKFLDHLAEDAMPVLIERLSTEASAKLL